MGKEIITIQIGKCGIQLGHELWKQLCSEHLIKPDGTSYEKKNKNINEKKEILFKETSNGKFIPRTLLFDLEPRILHNLNRSTYKNLYDKKDIIFSTQSAGNNWAKGYYQSIEYQNQIEENFRKNSEKCENLSTFNIFHSIAGGTGAGAGSLVTEIIRDEFPGKFINCYTVIPNQIGASDAVVQPYNSILSFRWLSLYADCVTFFENASMEKIVNSYNDLMKVDFQHINYLISKIINISTENIRFPTHLANSLESSFAGMIPTPNLHFLFAGISNWNFFPEKKNNFSSKIDLIKNLFEYKTVPFSFKQGKLISSKHFLNHSSNSFDFLIFLKKIHQIKHIKYIQWGSVFIDITNLNLTKNVETTLRNETCLFNHSTTKKLFADTVVQYDILRKRNAFLNNYLKNFSSGDGMELFTDAKETVLSLIQEYEQTETSVFF
jgi:tubulin gamma